MHGGPVCHGGSDHRGGSGSTPCTKLSTLTDRNGSLRVGPFIGVESDYASTICIRDVGQSYCEQTSVSKTGFRLNVRAWNNKGSILSVLFVGF